MRPTSRRLALALAITWAASTGCGGGSGSDPPTGHAISGTVTGAAGVTVALSGAATRTTTTGAGGAYAFTGLAAGAYTVTPSLAGFTFLPANRSVALGTADVTGQDFAGSPIVVGTHAVSGSITGPTLAGVLVTLGGDAIASTTTDATGHYAFTFLADGTYTVTPSAVGVLFAPQHRTAAVSGADLPLAAFAGTALAAYDDFSSGGVAASRWDSGERTIRKDGQAAALGADIANPEANTNYAAVLAVAPGAITGRVTSARATIRLDASAVAGDSSARAGLDLMFQPLADRVAAPANLTNMLILRAGLVDSATGLVAVRQVLECTTPTCSASVSVGALLSGTTWPGAGAAVTRGADYTVTTSIDTATGVVTFTLAGGAHTTPLTASLDLSAVATPFPADLREANFLRTRLFAMVRGGPTGGGSGSLLAHVDEVSIGVNGGAPVLHDDFSTGTAFDNSRWSVGEEGAEVTTSPPALRLTLEQKDSPAVASLVLGAPVTALQATVVVSEWRQDRTGQVGARLAAALYNDGTPGLPPAPDVPGPSSQVGDVIAQISMTATDVSYAVTRCNVAVCTSATGEGLTFLQGRTSLGTVALGQPHVLRLSWDATSHTVSFQLDGLPPVSFDPVAAGSPLVGAPGKPFWQVAAHAGAAGTGVDFTAGSSGRVVASFQDVRTH